MPRLVPVLALFGLCASCGGAKARPPMPPPEYEEPAGPTPSAAPIPPATPAPAAP